MQGILQITIARGRHRHLIIIYQLKGNLRIGNRQLDDKLIDFAALGIVGLQKLFPGRGIEKQILHPDGSADAAARFPNLRQAAAADFNLRPQLVTGLTGSQGKA